MQPLAEICRPQALSDIVGQKQILGEGEPLKKLIQSDTWPSLLFWGPPGTGKTTLASVIANTSQSDLVTLSAVSCGVKDIRKVSEQSDFAVSQGQKPLILFMDEIHRLSKSQQDVLLPIVEKGTVRLIGATTENPSFEVNNAILSRVLVFQLNPLSQDEVKDLLQRAASKVRPELKISDEVFQLIAESVSGDGRKSLNLLEAVLASTSASETVDVEVAKKFVHQIMRKYDQNGENHYDIVSALIKSIRASHPDAALHYLARMIDGGEKPEFIARRLLIAASEDIGNANPNALIVATNGMQAVKMLGYPEARIVLGQVTTYLASSPKSNASYKAVDSALADVKNFGDLEVPLHLRNAPTKFMANLGYGKGYIYPHDQPEEARKLPYLPSELSGKRYYNPVMAGVEKQIADNLKRQRPQAD